MRAARLHAPGDLRIEDVREPEPRDGELVLEIRAAGACGTDVKTYRRGHPILPPFPAPLGHELAGEIDGRRVFVANSAPCGTCFQCARGSLTLCEDLRFLLGGFGERLLVPERIARTNVHPLPDGLGFAVGALAEPLACAVRAVEVAAPVPGDRVAVLGAGPLGLMLTAVLADAGAEPVVLDPHEERLERARRFGAVETLRAERGPRDAERVRAACHGGRGADQAFEAVGRPEAWELAVASVHAGGAVNLFGGCAAGTTFTIPTARVHYDEVTVRGTFHHTPAHIRRALELLARRERPWDELAGPRIGLDELPAALAAGLPTGKVTVVPG